MVRERGGHTAWLCNLQPLFRFPSHLLIVCCKEPLSFKGGGGHQALSRTRKSLICFCFSLLFPLCLWAWTPAAEGLERHLSWVYLHIVHQWDLVKRRPWGNCAPYSRSPEVRALAESWGGGGGGCRQTPSSIVTLLPLGSWPSVKAAPSGDIRNFCLSVPRTRLQGHVAKHPNRHLKGKALLSLNMPFNTLLTIAVFNLHWWSIGCRWLRQRKWHQSFYFCIQQNAFSYNFCVYIEVTGKIFQTWTSFLFCKGNNNSLIVHL